MRLAVLASGSRGNAFVVEHDSHALFIDSGLSGREHARRLDGCGMSGVKPHCILLSHEHYDHSRGVGVLARSYGIPVFTSRGTAEAAERALGKLPELVGFENGSTMDMGPFQVTSFRVPHDAADPSGYVIEWSGGRLGVATDLGSAGPLIRHSLGGCTAMVLEFNHDEDMLWSGPYPWPLKQRIASSVGHLSNDSAAELLAGLVHPGLSVVVLAHLSEENNERGLALEVGADAAGPTRLVAGMQHLPLSCMDLG
jgi:phosphoribosyl 1,2-cyclic phosphodiesterase